MYYLFKKISSIFLVAIQPSNEKNSNCSTKIMAFQNMPLEFQRLYAKMKKL